MDKSREPGFGAPESGREIEPKPKSKKRRKKEEAAAEAEELEQEESEVEEVPETETEPDEQERREITAEAAFRERIALQELSERLPTEAYQQIVEALQKLPGTWSVEKGRHVFTRLVSEQEVSVDDVPVKVEYRLALSREAAPAEPQKVEEKISELVRPDESVEQNIVRLEPLKDELAPDDEVRISIAENSPDIIATSEAVQAEKPEPESEANQEPPLIDPERVEQAVDEIISEPLESEPVEPTESSDVSEVLDVLEREAVDLNELPTIAGAAPEADETTAEPADEELPETLPDELELPAEEPLVFEEEVPELAPQPTPEQTTARPSRRRPRRPAPEIFTWEPGWPEVVRGPDEAMKRKGRKLIRKLAAEYNIKLTPELEAYLLAILLRPGVVNGRKVYSLGINVETLMRVMGVLATGGYARPRS